MGVPLGGARFPMTPEVKFNLPVYGQLHVISAIPVRIYLSTHSTTFVTEKVIEMEIGICITATIILGECRTLWGERERVHAGAEFAWNSCMTLC